MKINEKQLQDMAKRMIESMKAQKCIEFKVKESEVFDRIIQILKADFEREVALDHEVNRMMDDLEKQNPGGFQRYKMFPMLKKRLAKEKGIIL